jgi:hypothetical protein
MPLKRDVVKTARRRPTQYLNVDLDIFSRVPLDGLVHAMGNKVFALYVGGKGRKYEAHVELASSLPRMTADRTIVGFTRLIEQLPPRHRRVWDQALAREFNVGIEAGFKPPHAFEVRLKRRTIEAIAEVQATLVVTVYAVDLQERRG